MSSPACADGYDTPAQQREDSTTFMVASTFIVAGSRSVQAAGGPGAPKRRHGYEHSSSNGIELDTVGRQFEPYRCGVTWALRWDVPEQL